MAIADEDIMLKNFQYRRSLFFCLAVGLTACLLLYNNYAPLVSWLTLIISQVALMVILLANSRATQAAPGLVPPTEQMISSNSPESLVKVVKYANQKSDATGQATPELPAGLSGIMGDHARELASQVRAYASVEDAQSYGWNFFEKIGVFQGDPIFRWARLDQKLWEYDGLTGANLSSVVPSEQRVFGRLRYKQQDETPVSSGQASPQAVHNEKVSTENTSIEDTQRVPST